MNSDATYPRPQARSCAGCGCSGYTSIIVADERDRPPGALLVPTFTAASGCELLCDRCRTAQRRRDRRRRRQTTLLDLAPRDPLSPAPAPSPAPPSAAQPASEGAPFDDIAAAWADLTGEPWPGDRT